VVDSPGLVVLFGSGETSASGRRVHDWVLHRLRAPIRLAVLETPAGFQPNSAAVAGEVASFFRTRLSNHSLQVEVIPARQRGTALSPDNREIVAPLRQADAIFLGPGSPTYAVRQLQGSLLWQTLVARHRLGTAVILASAATIAASAQTLPVYEIYKVGEDLHWRPGLNLLAEFGLSLALVSHWDNSDGGAALDTSRCFMGRARFERLLSLLPSGVQVVGIDEHTALVMDLQAGQCRVMGRGAVTLLMGAAELRFSHGQAFDIEKLGPFRVPEPSSGVAREVWDWVQSAGHEAIIAADVAPQPPAEVLELAARRQAAREHHDWLVADDLRRRIQSLGWEVRDTANGFELRTDRRGS